MPWKKTLLTVAVCSIGLAWVAEVMAQPPRRRPAVRRRAATVAPRRRAAARVVPPRGRAIPRRAPALVDPRGRPVARRDGYRRVVPPYLGRRGTYYVYEDRYYYTPPIVVGADPPLPVLIEFGSFSYIEDLAARLEDLANELCLDLHYNYGHNPGFRETYRDAYQILQTAQYVRDSEVRGDRDEVVQSVAGLDELFHYVEGSAGGWSRRHVRQVGEGGIITKMEDMEALIHHLMYTVGIEPHAAEEVAPPPESGAEVAPPPV